MKKIVIIIALAGFISACNKLDEKPESLITKEQSYKTEADALAGVTAIYNELVSDPGEQAIYGRNLNFLADMTTDDLSAGSAAINPNVQSLSKVTYDAGNDRVLAIWRQHYTGINRANVAIDKIQEMTFNEASKLRLVQEAKFLRALFYFNLVRLYGGVPLVLHDATSVDLDALKANRASTAEVYAQIIADLTDAENLPKVSGSELGRASGGAAKALLAKVYLTLKDWDNAIKKAGEVINGGYGYNLFPDFADNFKASKKNTVESIFAAQFEANGGAGISSAIFLSTSAPSPAGNRADVPADGQLYALYAAGDKRRDATFYTSKVFSGTTYTYSAPGYFNKYVDDALLATPYLASVNFPILRYSDVLLIYAEALNEKNGPSLAAYDAINKVRRRAFAKDINTADVSVDLAGLTQGSFRTALYLERRFEFVQEAQRWFDLVRTGRLVSEVSKVATKTSVSERNNLFPIPQSEINLNPEGLPQNPGYTP